jgi:hypothetical protein
MPSSSFSRAMTFICLTLSKRNLTQIRSSYLSHHTPKMSSFPVLHFPGLPLNSFESGSLKKNLAKNAPSTLLSQIPTSQPTSTTSSLHYFWRGTTCVVGGRHRADKRGYPLSPTCNFQRPPSYLTSALLYVPPVLMIPKE